jgi:hypothetical protein
MTAAWLAVVWVDGCKVRRGRRHGVCAALATVTHHFYRGTGE